MKARPFTATRQRMIGERSGGLSVSLRFFFLSSFLFLSSFSSLLGDENGDFFSSSSLCFSSTKLPLVGSCRRSYRQHPLYRLVSCTEEDGEISLSWWLSDKKENGDCWQIERGIDQLASSRINLALCQTKPSGLLIKVVKEGKHQAALMETRLQSQKEDRDGQHLMMLCSSARG
ncbi:uncharacterized protein LOC108850245 isoform X2 [Raphanus sativus]|uniref:Uncharacterized protein LOC108850245 isoform X2 n=1 Tax=Raphanus sativus TaxID=3726 RepID=A0A9W3DIF7_RAPSA|nr:uncharacterized protein LOC108850245 isoform X2 [Raphanus sativus]